MLRQIFLPYLSFRESVACYSDWVLLQTFQIITNNAARVCNGTAHRRICYDWRQWGQAFINLGIMCADELDSRNLIDTREKVSELSQRLTNKRWKKPFWASWNRLLSSHRAALLQIGEVERFIPWYIKWEHLENIAKMDQLNRFNEWLRQEGFGEIWGDNARGITELCDLLGRRGIFLFPGGHLNHYAQFGWAEEARGQIDVFPPEEVWASPYSH